MSMDADMIADRRRLRRKLSFWRVVAFLVAAAALVAVIAIAGSGGDLAKRFRPQVARITIDGFISEDRDRLALIEKLARTDQVRAVIVSIDSSGGSTVGGEALHDAIRKLSKAKPTVAQMGTIAASAAYMAAIGTDHIVARRTTLTGSIGVIFEAPEVSRLLDKLGISVTEIKSGALKAEPSPLHPPSEEAKKVMAEVIADTHRWFVGLVAERRGLDRAAAEAVSDGRIFSGQQALQAKLVDELGDEKTARAWLEREKGISPSLPLRDWTPERSGNPFSVSDAALAWLARSLGLPVEAVRGAGLEQLLPLRLKLDGLLSVWQGSADQRDGEGAQR